MLYPGIVSVSFRNSAPREIVDSVRRTPLRGIEWSSASHVLAGDRKCAEEVRKMMDDHSLVSPSYGTYYYAGAEGNPEFERLIENAVILGAPVLRVWAGKNEATAEMTPERREFITDDLRRICTLASKSGLKVSTEYHNHTLTDTFESAQQLFRDVPELYTHWQADEGRCSEGHLKVLTALLPRLTVVHAAWWVNHEQRPFSEAGDEWKDYVRLLNAQKEDRFVILEFVRGGTFEQMYEDSEALSKLVQIK